MDKSSAIIFLIFVFISFIGIILSLVISRKLFAEIKQREDTKFSAEIKWKLTLTGAIIFLFLSLGTAAYNIYFISKSEEAIGTIVDVIAKKDDDGSVFFYPVYKYQDSLGNIYQGKAEVGTGSSYVLNQKIGIRFLSESPHTSRVDSFSNIWFTTLIFAILSVILFVIGSCMKRYFYKKFS